MISEATRALAACADPVLVGVRHHSPALAAALPALLEAAAPDRLLVELPSVFQAWIPWLGHAELVAPVALAAAGPGDALGFYPFAAFSPELVAVRWAVARGIPVEPFDLPPHRRTADEEGPAGPTPGLMAAARGEADEEDWWDRQVEALAPGAPAEALRVAGLAYGLAVRASGGRHLGSDLAREQFMRDRLAAARAGGARRLVAVVGAFHAAGLHPDPAWDPLPRRSRPLPTAAGEPVTSLVPYRAELLDSRSGYPAGIRDPRWQEAVHEALQGPAPAAALDGLAARMIVEVGREVRRVRHQAGTPDVTEALRLARGLAALRDLPAPGRREVLEGVETALGRGEGLGRQRVLGRALEKVMIGVARGRLAPGTPRSGLAPAVEQLVKALGLPGPDQLGDPPKRLQLDPLRGGLDRRRHVLLRRLEAAGVVYGELEAEDEGRLSRPWKVEWSAATEATLMGAALLGPTPAVAASGALRAKRPDTEAGGATGAWIGWLMAAAEAGLPAEVEAALRALQVVVPEQGSLAEVVAAIGAVDRLRHGHVAGLPAEGDAADVPGAVRAWRSPLDLDLLRDAWVAAAVRAAEGLEGSEDPEEVQALIGLVRWHVSEGRLGDGRLGALLQRFSDDGAAPMQAAGAAGAWLLGRVDTASLATRVAGWVDTAADAEAHARLAGRFTGLALAVSTELEADADLQRPLLRRVVALTDDDFLRVLPALREGFDALSPAARGRMLSAFSLQLGGSGRVDALAWPPEQLARWALRDRRAAAQLGALGLEVAPWGAQGPAAVAVSEVGATPAGSVLSALDRWRLVLGQERKRLQGRAGACAAALEHGYGGGQGEGARGQLGGDDPAFPSAREWGEALGAAFDAPLREEVLGRAASRGDVGALLALDPDSVTPSMGLLETVLSLRGSLSEGQLGPLRRLVARCVEALSRALAQRVRPALSGLSTPRPTSRRTGRLDLSRTIRKNLHRAVQEGAAVRLVPEQLVFRTRAVRAMDWRVVLVVDTSGSMEASAIHAALMAAILSSLPAVSVDFLAFNTEVVDMTDRVDDPLALLLEVSIGGGTDIARAMRAARERVRVPQRTLLVLVSDFEEGGSVPRLLDEVRALAASGVKLLGLAALDDDAKPRFSAAIAEQLVAAGMPVAAMTPVELAGWVAGKIR